MYKLYGIKNCDSVKKARRWFDGHGLAYEYHDFRDDGLSAKQIKTWLAQVGADRLINRRSTTWKQLSAAEQQQLDSAASVALLEQYPTLIKRPVLVIKGHNIKVGFSEQDYNSLL